MCIRAGLQKNAGAEHWVAGMAEKEGEQQMCACNAEKATHQTTHERSVLARLSLRMGWDGCHTGIVAFDKNGAERGPFIGLPYSRPGSPDSSFRDWLETERSRSYCFQPGCKGCWNTRQTARGLTNFGQAEQR